MYERHERSQTAVALGAILALLVVGPWGCYGDDLALGEAEDAAENTRATSGGNPPADPRLENSRDDDGFFGGEGEGEGEGGMDASEAGGGRTIDVGVGQGGAQDFGIFRRILDEGGLPLPETLDDVGFFAEHHTELPPPDCGDALCLHGMLGVMGNMISGSNCTMLQLGMNARVEEDSIRRLPLNLAVAIDTSGSMRAAGKIDFVRRGLELLVENLEPEDELTLITYSNEARVVIERADADARGELLEIIGRLEASGGTNLHDGLRLAFDQVQRASGPDVQNRVILLSDGQPTVGVTESGQIIEMARAFQQEGIGLTTIGVGTEFNPTLMRTLSEAGSGNFYFVEDESAVEEVFVEEISYFVTPIATNVRLDVTTGGAYNLREVFGTKLWATADAGGVIEIPSLFIAHRQSADDQEQGRRGGGSAILLELLPQRGWQDDEGVNSAEVATMTLSYLPAGGNLRVERELSLSNPNDPGVNPSDGFFSGGTPVEKNFVMLNIYVGLRMASQRVEDRDLNGAYSLLTVLEESVADWEGQNNDEDIEDDLGIIRQYIRNLLEAGARDPSDEPDPPEPWPQD